MQSLVILQSLWAMERRHTDGFEPTLDANVEAIRTAGFEGISAHWTDGTAIRRMVGAMQGTGLVAEGVCFPKTIDDLKPILELATRFPVHHLNVQPDVRLRRLDEALALIDGWQRLIEQVDFPV